MFFFLLVHRTIICSILLVFFIFLIFPIISTVLFLIIFLPLFVIRLFFSFFLILLILSILFVFFLLPFRLIGRTTSGLLFVFLVYLFVEMPKVLFEDLNNLTLQSPHLRKQAPIFFFFLCVP